MPNAAPTPTISKFEDVFAHARYNKQNFGRHVACEVYQIEGNKILTIARMHDDYHDISLAILIGPNLDIEAVAPKMDRIPYPVCSGAVEAYGRMVGLNVFKRGILKEVRDLVGRTAGCTHLFELVESTLRGLFAAMYSMRGFDIRDMLNVEEVRQVNLHSPLLNDTCHSFSNKTRDDKTFDVAVEKLTRKGIPVDKLSPISRQGA